MFILGNRYNVISEIERTETSTVYIGNDLKNKSETVAIKILTLPNTDDSIVRELFRRECDSLSRLKHNNIIRYIDSGIDNNQLYIVMEYFNGVDLYKFAQRNILSLEDALKISLEILEGIKEAHNKNVIHRDLKPSNILIDDLHNIKIIDFGISKIIGLTYKTCDTVKDYMSFLYAAPEQLLRFEAIFQSDIFSLGLIICFLLSGKEPPDERGKLNRYVENLNCSIELKELLNRLLRKESSERPNTVYQVIREVKKEYYKVLSKTKRIYLKFNSYIQRQLHEIGVVDYVNSVDSSRNFIIKDIEKSSIYKNKNQYYLVGRDVIYTCQVASDFNYLKIVKINSIDTQNDYEREYHKGVEIEIPWIVQNEFQQAIPSDDLKEILQVVNDEEKRRKTKQKKENIHNELLKKWEKYLDEEFIELDSRKKLCNYNDFDLDDTGSKILVKVNQIDFAIEKGEILQMTSKSKQQITVGTYNSISEKSIEIILKSDIDIENISKLGVLGIDVVQAQTSLKRLKYAWKAIKYRDTINPNLPDLLSDPFTITINNVSPIRNFFQANLDISNTRAVEKALATKDLFLIQGPPGTGKTTVITEIVCQILNEDPNAKILLTSQSHVAVDHAINKISKLLPNNRIVRIGRSEKISEESQNLLMSTQLNSWVNNVKKESRYGLLNYLNSQYNLSEDETKMINLSLDRLGDDEDIKNEKTDIDSLMLVDDRLKRIKNITMIAKQWYRRLGKLEEFDEIFAAKTSIVAATCLGIASRHVLNSMTFDWVIVDEAARATPLELLVPIVRGKKIILVGDHRQLPPIIKTDIDKLKLEEKGLKTSDLEKSLFEELIDNMPDEAKIVLTSQFRMHPTIAKLIAEIFYPSDNISTLINASDRNHHLKWWPKAVAWIDTQKLYDNEEQDTLFSKRNQGEARVILHMLQYIENLYRTNNVEPISVGVISGYDAQKSLLQNLISPGNSEKWKKLRILIDNVDAFQGSETDIVFYSLVRCNKENKIGFLYDERRLNVALSRGRNCLIIVGNMNFADRARSFRGNPFVDIIRFLKKNPDGCIMEVYNEH